MGKNDKEVRSRIVVEEYTGGLIGPSLEMVGTLKDGGTISTVSPPGCWGPMITPEFLGGHEVSRPVAVQGARVGDAVAIFIQKVWVRSQAASSGTMTTKPEAFGSDPFVDKHCPKCKTPWPQSRIEGTGPECVRCVACGAEASPFAFEEGYTIAFDERRREGGRIPLDNCACGAGCSVGALWAPPRTGPARGPGAAPRKQLRITGG